MEAKKNLCAMIPADLHAKVIAEKEELDLGVYFEQNVTTERFEDFDGDRWVIVGE